MPFDNIAVPESIKNRKLSPGVEDLIDRANDRLESFLLADEKVIENFVTCDFHLLAQAIDWIEQNHLLTGKRFCEIGSGFGIGAMLAAYRGMESIGIEIEPILVEQSSKLANDLNVNVEFYCGSFIPRGIESLEELASDIRHVDTHDDDVFDEIGLSMDDFDLFFAFPWPGEHTFFESVLDARAADGALLLTYRGRDGMNLVRKV
jgi:cyclopropane fatty-acyl-phospholipid synthase-like methyltransferase